MLLILSCVSEAQLLSFYTWCGNAILYVPCILGNFFFFPLLLLYPLSGMAAANDRLQITHRSDNVQMATCMSLSFQSDDEGSFILSSLLVCFIQKAVVSAVCLHCNSHDIEDSETVPVSNSNWNSLYWLGCNITFGAFKNQQCYLRSNTVAMVVVFIMY